MRFLKSLVLIIGILFSGFSFAGPNFSDKQIDNLSKAYHYGQKRPSPFKNSRVEFGYIMAAILWQESSAGMNCGKNGHAVGAFQNYVPTVKSRMKQDGTHKPSHQIAKELSNFNTSAHWASVELNYWLKVHNGNMNKALASYNAGWNTKAGASYSNSVMRKAVYLKQNNVLKVEK